MPAQSLIAWNDADLSAVHKGQTLTIYFLRAPSPPGLKSLARLLHLPVYSPHNALGDALTTAVLFLALSTEIEREYLAKGNTLLSLRTLMESSKNSSWRA